MTLSVATSFPGALIKRLRLIGALVFAVLMVGVSVALASGIQAFGADMKDVTFADKALYSRVCDELGEKIASTDDATRTVRIAESDISSVKSLSLRADSIEDLSGIESFTSLENLDISQNKVKSIRPLADLTNLRTLNAYDNVIRDLDGLQGLTNLATLKLGRNNEAKRTPMQNLDALENLAELKELDFSQNYTPAVLPHIAGLERLEVLRLEWNYIEEKDDDGLLNMRHLANLTNLRSVNLFENRFTSINTLYGLTRLEEVIVSGNKLGNISGMLQGDALVWPNLKKFDIYGNRYELKNSDAVIGKLKEMSAARVIEFDYKDIVDVSGLPHVDGLTRYVTYEDFGARCDGVYDDYVAIRAAHDFANSAGCEVRATTGKTYHIFNYYKKAVTVSTNTDWMNARFIVHDEVIDEQSGEFNRLFIFENTPDRLALPENVLEGFNNGVINTRTQKIPGISPVLSGLNEKGYTSYLCAVMNKDKRQFIRAGADANSGFEQQDYFTIDNEGNVLDDIQWDFDHVTSFELLPIANEALEVKNGNFVTNTFNSERELPSGRSGLSKQSLVCRDLRFENATNVVVSNVNHALSKDCMSGSYASFIYLYRCANVAVRDSSLFSRKSDKSGTYELQISRCANVLVKDVVTNDIHDPGRWGIVGTNIVKDLTYDGCTLNVIDAHMGNCNLEVKNCDIGYGSILVVGQGSLDIVGTTVSSEVMVSLRSDYGSMWNGDAKIIDSKYVCTSQDIPRIFKIKFNYDDKDNYVHHDFGYDRHFPNLYVDNLTVDLGLCERYGNPYAITNNGMIGNPYHGFPEYWAQNVYLNRCNVLNAPTASPAMKLTWQKIDKNEGTEYNYSITDLSLMTEDDSGTEDITRDCYGSDAFTTPKTVKLSLRENASTTNTVSIYMDGRLVEGGIPVSGEFVRTFDEDGTYKVEVESVDRFCDGDNTGKAEYCFTVERPKDPSEVLEVSFPDQVLYKKVCGEIDGLIKSKDDSSQTVRITRANLESVTELCLRDGEIANVSGLESFTSLERLDLCQNKIANVAGLTSLKNLRALNLFDNVISDIGGIGNLTNLTRLNLGYNNESDKRNGIAHLEELRLLVNLEYFNFSQNWTPDICTYISNLTKLKTLCLERDAGSGQLDLSPIANLTELRSINAYYSGVRDITPLYGLPNLEEVLIQRNYISSIAPMLQDGHLVWPNLKKLDLAKNNKKLDAASGPVLDALRQKAAARELELNYEDATDTSGLPHVDAAGLAYVAYDDFGARCDGVYDDWIAIRNAHAFANSYTANTGSMCEVRATPGKTYHIFKYYEAPGLVKTDVDWQGATIVIHDENIEECSGRIVNIMEFDNSVSEDIVKIENPSFTIGKSTKKITALGNALSELNAKGYKSYLCAAYNKDKRQFLRTGSTQSADQQDYFVMDSQGNVQNDIQWDFEYLTSFELIPMKDIAFKVRNANIITNSQDYEAETATRSGTGKWQYSYRGFLFRNSANLQVSGLRHTMTKDCLSGSYDGFYMIDRCANVQFDNCTVWAKKYITHSTYDLTLNRSVNLQFKNVVSNNIEDTDRWGVNCSDFVKDVYFERCSLNRIDAHQGMYNLTVVDSEIGSKGLTLTGQGNLDVIRTRITSHAMFPLRGDYGSTWNGNARFIDCTYRKILQKVPMISQFSFSWDDAEHTRQRDFGYELRYPNIYIDNLTIDYEYFPNSGHCYAVCNDPRYVGDYPWGGYETYWPHNVYINRYTFANNNKKGLAFCLSYNKIDGVAGDTYNYAVTDLTLTKGGKLSASARAAEGAGADITRECFGKSGYVTDEAVDMVLKANTSASNTVSIYRDGSVVEKDVPVDSDVVRRFTQEGAYKIEIASVDRFLDGSNTGCVEYTFKIGAEGAAQQPGDSPGDEPPATHVHELQLIPTKAATCSQEGRKAYYSCMSCGKRFADAAGKTEVASLDALALPVDTDAHEWDEWIVVTAPTETAKGMQRRKCKIDPMHVDMMDIPPRGHAHSMMLHAAVAATCTANGSIAYWTCAGCGLAFSDQKGTNAVKVADTVVKATGHSLQHVPAKAPTVEAAGNTEHYACASCARLFADAEGTREVSAAETVLAKLPSGGDGGSGADTDHGAQSPDDSIADPPAEVPEPDVGQPGPSYEAPAADADGDGYVADDPLVPDGAQADGAGNQLSYEAPIAQTEALSSNVALAETGDDVGAIPVAALALALLGMFGVLFSARRMCE